MAIDLRPPPDRGAGKPCPGPMRQASQRARSAGLEADARAALRTALAGTEEAAMAQAVWRLLELTRGSFRIGADD